MKKLLNRLVEILIFLTLPAVWVWAILFRKIPFRDNFWEK